MTVHQAVVPLRFTKMHGAGNDFVVIDQRHLLGELKTTWVQAIANRHLGVGCDQLLSIELPRHSDAIASYRIWNADGSVASQCGNGGRCVAAWLVRNDEIEQPSFVIESPVGRHQVQMQGQHNCSIAMGRPHFAPARVPLHGYDEQAPHYTLHVDELTMEVGAVSFGNPHVVLEVANTKTVEVEKIGRALQHHPAFPESVNVSFAQVCARDQVVLRVYERGVGETLACGSAACAAAVVLMRQNRVDRHVAIHLPGGQLTVTWPSDDQEVSLAGPVAFVFTGDYLL